VEKCGAVQKMKNYITVSLPLLFRVLSKGTRFSLAMYYYKLDFSVRRSSFKEIHASIFDALFLTMVFFSIAGALFSTTIFLTRFNLIKTEGVVW
jgi:energy-coupling factor transport system permease protein